ncbi:MAG: hypothetical protein K2P88_12465 [Chitinophagaceae bacterium]|uniref:hypothetical protein n=1 Tax=unclassified Paraflavitalea TaxID=2798305 RepID=UPI003D355755|nr:hypothetical protein [Chitinophagaceae bacterium]
MNRIQKIYSTLFLVCLQISAFAGTGGDTDPWVEKTKTYSKSYTLSGSDAVSISNQFGDIKYVNWDKSEVKVDVTMVGKAKTEDVAEELLDRLSIEDGKSGSTVNFKTKMKDSWGKGSRYNNTSFSINYVVYIPSTATLNSTNQFGKTFIGDYKGAISIEQKFGVLTAGKLSNVKSIEIEFSGGSSIESINGGTVSIKFSKTLISKVEGTVKMNLEHNGSIKLGLDNALKSLTIKNNFNELLLDVSKDFSANCSFHTNFSELKNKTGFDIDEDKEDNDRRGPKFDHDYNGKCGNGGATLKVNSEFGDVIMGHQLNFNLNEGKKKEREI